MRFNASSCAPRKDARHRDRPMGFKERLGLGLVILVLMAAFARDLSAATPVTMLRSEAGSVNFTGTGGTLRQHPNRLDACAVGNWDTARLSGLPAGATITHATLYWAGSWSLAAGSTRTSPDWEISFEGQQITAQRRHTDIYDDGTAYDFFNGAADVTAIVAAKGNGNYSFGDLSVNTGAPHCPVQAVLAGWSLLVVYTHPGEPLRVLNIYEGFQAYRGGSLNLNPSNFRIPNQDIEGSYAHVTWEGDRENSDAFNGVREQVLFNNQTLRTRLNPWRNPFNSTVTWTNDRRSYGVDFDRYDISRYLRAGDESASSRYSSGRDLALLSSVVIAVTNTPVANLALDKSHAAPFIPGGQGEFRLLVSNDGPSDTDAPVTVTDVLPSGLSYAGAVAPGWTVDASAAPAITFSWSGASPAGSSLPPIVLRVAVDSGATGDITNTASVACATFDHDLSDNHDEDTVILAPPAPDIVLVKEVRTLSDPHNGTDSPKAIPGALLIYRMQASNVGPGSVDADGLHLSDRVPPDVDLFLGDLAAPGSGPLLFVDGDTPSGLAYIFGGLGDLGDALEFSVDGSDYSYIPSPDTDGYDPAVRHFRIRPNGVFVGATETMVMLPPPSFSVQFQAKLR